MSKELLGIAREFRELRAVGVERAARLAACSMVLASLTGCAAPGRAPQPRVEEPLPDPRTVRLYEGQSGASSSWDALVRAARECDVFLIGENHGHRLGLALAAEVWKDTLAEAPQAALCMEFFERDQQSYIDDYVSGLTDEATFKKRAGKNERNYPEGHRAMVEAAKAAGVPVFAANSPRVYVSTARKEGYERLAGLTAEQKRLFRVPDVVPAGRYRHDFEKIMSEMAAGHTTEPKKPPAEAEGAKNPHKHTAEGHGETAAAEAEAGADEEDSAEDAWTPTPAYDAGFKAQSLWDWTMGESVVRALAEERRPVFLVVGRFHVDFHGGTPQAIDLLRPGTKIVILSVVDEWSEGLAAEDTGRGDFVAYVGPRGEE